MNPVLVKLVMGTGAFSFPFPSPFLDRFKRKRWHHRFRFVSRPFFGPFLDRFLDRFVQLATSG